MQRRSILVIYAFKKKDLYRQINSALLELVIFVDTFSTLFGVLWYFYCIYLRTILKSEVLTPQENQHLKCLMVCEMVNFIAQTINHECGVVNK